jgi:glycosyltransferase involved in cell wall biosynthesis
VQSADTAANRSARFGQTAESDVELSVVIPCLNEAETLGECINRARRGLSEAGVEGEIIVADNGSTDGSQAIAEQLGARVIAVSERGYGAALMGGIAAAQGTWVLMGDADGSYDFHELPRFVAKLREGDELVQGCRLESGGGTVMPGAMPMLHRWWGNPMFSRLARWWFRAPVHDVYCGLRAFRKDFYQRLDQRCTGMEFATEMIIKASLHGARIGEVPITLWPDGRTAHPPHLRTFRDGWRTLRFFLMFSPRWLFFMPGVALIALGVLGYAIALPGVTWRGVNFDVHTLLFASLFIICGYQSIVFAVLTKTFGITEGLLPPDRRMETFWRVIDLERGLLVGMGGLLVGIPLLIAAVLQWWSVDFGSLDYSRTMRLVIPGFLFTILGVQTILYSFFGSILGLRRR